MRHIASPYGAWRGVVYNPLPMNDIYTHTVPLFIKMLGGIRKLLDKADAFAKENNLDIAELLSARLASDMYPLSRQVQIACDNAKGAVSRLSGVENPKHDDTETTILELQARIDKTLEFLKSVPESSFADAAEKRIELKYYPGKYMTGADYAREHVVPNFLFHVVTAYDILRHKGLPLQKQDYINGLPLRDL
jgi:hypothetical protein